MGRILHLSDIHFGSENHKALDAVFELAVREPFDLIAITGDITQYGAVAEFAAAETWIKSLPGPLLITPGNHDTPWAGLFSRVAMPFARYQRAFGDPWDASFEDDEITARTFNTARGVQIRLNWSKGAARLSHVESIARIFKAAPHEKLRVVLCHHPLTEMTGGPMTARVRGGLRAASVLAAAGTDIILTGHIHSPFVFPLALGEGRTLAIGASTLSTRERGVPPGFNIVCHDPDTVRVTAHGWTGSHFETVRTWGLPRRPRP
jgi:3',5'-cyclic AMP phosphodiesterase CpdA